ncbi:MAG: hypothetical protein QNJ44_16690 [Rhodobacter sp.]|nr:hypothetical protein [Rhodobacter sp.]
MDRLRQAAEDYGQEWTMDLRFTRFRGDGWQVYLKKPLYVLDATIYFLAWLRAADLDIETRISVGIGPVDSTGTADLSDASGRAFFVSGDHLDRIPKRRRLVIAGDGIGIWQTSIFDLVEHQTAGWTAAQAEAVALALLHASATHEDLSDRLGITRQAVQSRLAAAGWSALTNPLGAFRGHEFAPKTDR